MDYISQGFNDELEKEAATRYMKELSKKLYNRTPKQLSSVPIVESTGKRALKGGDFVRKSGGTTFHIDHPVYGRMAKGWSKTTYKQPRRYEKLREKVKSSQKPSLWSKGDRVSISTRGPGKGVIPQPKSTPKKKGFFSRIFGKK